jgi:hypothetical protein
MVCLNPHLKKCGFFYGITITRADKKNVIKIRPYRFLRIKQGVWLALACASHPRVALACGRHGLGCVDDKCRSFDSKMYIALMFWVTFCIKVKGN